MFCEGNFDKVCKFFFFSEGKLQILCDVEDILTLVDNHLIKCVYIRGSAFVKPLIGKFWFSYNKSISF